MKRISFCSTCKNRFHQISKTLPSNLEHNKGNKDTVEFVVVDLGSTDGLQNWILSNFRNELDEGYLNYFYTGKMKSWHASIAKNTAHYYAQGEFLVNLDCDNFTGKNGGKYVIDQFEKYGDNLLLHQNDGVRGKGSCGRIGMHRKYFHEIGGYDESFEPIGSQDLDLVRRLQEMGLIFKRFPNPLYVETIPNTKLESVKFCNSALSWEQMEHRNLKASRLNIYTGNLIANGGIFGYRNDVFTYKDGQIINTRELSLNTDIKPQ